MSEQEFLLHIEVWFTLILITGVVPGIWDAWSGHELYAGNVRKKSAIFMPGPADFQILDMSCQPHTGDKCPYFKSTNLRVCTDSPALNREKYMPLESPLPSKLT